MMRMLLTTAVMQAVHLLPSSAAPAQFVPATGATEQGRSTTRSAGAFPLVFAGVTVVDVERGRHLADQDVVVVGNHIQTVGDARSIKLPKEAQVVDARGKYLIPGLWDMHNHPMCYPQVFYPLLIANGVTGIRDPGNPVPLDTVLQWRREIAAGTRVGPRMVVSGPSLDERTMAVGIGGGTKSRFCGSRPITIQVRTPADAKRVVDSLVRAGADFIKVHNFFKRESRAVYFAIAAVARQHGIPLSGHLPNWVTAIEASDSGQKAIDHFNAPNLQSLCLDDSASTATCVSVAARFRHNGTWFVPTLVIRDMVFQNGKDSPSEPVYLRLKAHMRESLRYWPDSVFNLKWLASLGSGDSSDSMADSVANAVRRSTSSPRPLLRIVHEVGMPVLAGTDAALLWPMIAPGFSLHAELAILVAEGLTPLEALQAATLNPARFLGAIDSLGTVAPGKLADLVLLDADPLEDIQNTSTIRAVVANGRYYDRAALDALLHNTERAAHR